MANINRLSVAFVGGVGPEKFGRVCGGVGAGKIESLRFSLTMMWALPIQFSLSPDGRSRSLSFALDVFLSWYARRFAAAAPLANTSPRQCGDGNVSNKNRKR